MLIPFQHIFKTYNLNPLKSILHIGAHKCEERNAYHSCGFTDKNIFWIEANPHIVELFHNEDDKNIQIFNAVVSNKDYETVDFIITNNGESSSILELDEHKKEHPWVHETERLKLKTTTIDTFLNFHKDIIDANSIEFINMDIQGAELLALQGMENFLKSDKNNVKVIYAEVNTKHLYKDCALVHEIDEFLEAFNFHRVETTMTQHGWGDAIYFRNL
jgi:FkbM family methyltransferase